MQNSKSHKTQQLSLVNKVEFGKQTSSPLQPPSPAPQPPQSLQPPSPAPQPPPIGGSKPFFVPALRSPTSPSQLTNRALYQLCQHYGLNAKIWLRKFAGLLPEVYKRDLYRKHGCASIHEFAKKLAGMHERTVDKILNLYKHLQNTPHLLKIFESGEQGWSKLEVVAFIANVENDKDLAEKVRSLPQAALKEYVKHHHKKITVDGQVQNNFGILQVGDLQVWPQVLPMGEVQVFSHQAIDSLHAANHAPDSLHAGLPANPSTANQTTSQAPNQIHPDNPTFAEAFTTISFPISQKSRSKLQLIKQQLENKHKITLSYDEVIKLLPAQSTVIIKKVCPKCAMKAAQICAAQVPSTPQRVPKKPSRPIPKPIQKLILSQHGQFCVFPNCHRPFHEFHHTRRFASHKNHNPAYIFPLCKTHHTLAHAGLIANENLPPKNWYIKGNPQQSGIDKKVMEYKAAEKRIM